MHDGWTFPKGPYLIDPRTNGGGGDGLKVDNVSDGLRDCDKDKRERR